MISLSITSLYLALKRLQAVIKFGRSTDLEAIAPQWYRSLGKNHGTNMIRFALGTEWVVIWGSPPDSPIPLGPHSC